MKVRIGDKLIGGDEPCFIIAEAGVNHNGDISLAIKLIDAAGEAGADAVKFQTFRTEALVTRQAEKARYQKETTGDSQSQFNMLKSLELTESEFGELFHYARQKGLIFLSSPFDKSSVDLLDGLGVPAFKIASGEITNFPLLRHIACRKRPVILSTGMCNLDEIEEALKVIRGEGTEEIVLLHCVSAYPAGMEDVNLRAMGTMRKAFKLPVGLSDHTPGLTVPIAAVAIGANVIEKHFTLDKNLAGPDQRLSLEPGELKEMVKAIRDVEKARGDGVKQPVDSEARAARRSIVAKVDISRGTAITEEMLDVKRPGTGLEPKYIDSLLGKRAVRDIKQDELIMRDEVQD